MINKQKLEMAKKKADKSNDTELYFELLNVAYRLLKSPEPEIKELWEETSLAIDAFEEAGVISKKRSQRLEIINNINISKMLKEGSEEARKRLIQKGEWYDSEDENKRNIFLSKLKQ